VRARLDEVDDAQQEDRPVASSSASPTSTGGGTWADAEVVALHVVDAHRDSDHDGMVA
jgi:hypothetical protein